MSANLENSAVAIELEKVISIPIPKKGNEKECSNHQTIELISQTSKVMLNILSSTRTKKFQIYTMGFKEAEEPEIK